MITRHEGGRIHVGMLFQEAHDRCIEAHPDDSKAAEVCFHCMTERLKEVADLLERSERQLDELKAAVTDLSILAQRYVKPMPEVLIGAWARVNDALTGRTAKSQVGEHCKNGPECAAYDCTCPCGGCKEARCVS